MKKKFRIIITIAAAIAFSWLISPFLPGLDNDIRFKRLTIDDGLSQSTINCIFQDHKGFMWFGTQNGLNRFDGYRFKIYRNDPDDPTTISDDYILSIAEDSNDVLWVGTKNGGLNRLDRDKDIFLHYNNNPEKLKIFDSTGINAIFKDKSREGILWLGTYGGGLKYFDTSPGKFDGKFKDIELKPDCKVVDVIYEDPQGVLWIGTRGNGLIKLEQSDNDKWHPTPFLQDANNRGSLGNSVRAICEDRFGILWIGTDGGGLYRFDENQKIREFIPFNNSSSNVKSDKIQKKDRIRALLVDREGLIWIGSQGGLEKLDPANNTITPYKNSDTDAFSLSQNYVVSLFEDRSGLLWIGTYESGLNIYDRDFQQFKLYRKDRDKPYKLISNNVWSVYEDGNDNLWVGTFDKGLTHIDRNTGVSTNLLADKHVICLFADSTPNCLWVGTNSEGLFKVDTQKFRVLAEYKFNRFDDEKNNIKENNTISAICEGEPGYLRIATIGGGIKSFNKENGEYSPLEGTNNGKKFPSNNFVRTILKTRDGVLWIGTEGSGLDRYDTGKEWENFPQQKDVKESLSHNRIRSIYEDNSGILWIGTDGGLNRMVDREKGRFIAYRVKDKLGLPNDTIYGILEDETGYLWLSTNMGLSRFDPKAQEVVFINYNVADGLQSNEFCIEACFKNNKGEMFFGGINGLTAFFPTEIKRSNDKDKTDKPAITDFLLFNKPTSLHRKDPNSPLQKPISETDALTLSYDQNTFSFEFAGLDFTNPRNIRYRYRLDGPDEKEKWTETGADYRRATYTNLPQGLYVFEVQAGDRNGNWNKPGVSIKLTIPPPPWKTWWAYIIYGILFCALLYLVWMVIAAQHLKEVDRLKDDFLSKTSHELRTPLNGIIGIAHSLIDGATGQLPPSTNENLTMIAASGKRLHLLVNDILDSSSLRAGKLKLHKKPVDLHTLTDIIFKLSEPLIGSKEIQLINDIKPGEFLVEADEDRLQQIIYNLVGNAVKFTDAGEVRVSAVINGRVHHVRVSDTGIGIPREKFERIFESFEQVQGAADRAYGGTGLGLSIVKHLVELHGGKIWVESIVGSGTTFTFTLPRWEGNIEKPAPGIPPGAIPPGEAPAMQLTGSPGETAGRIRILVVEDDPVNLQVVLNFLNPVLYAVTPVSDGPQALAVLGSGEIFDLVLLDIMMPRMSGYEVCRKIRERFQPNELPVIFLTAKTQTADLETSISAGGNDFITKPFEKENLLSCIEKHLRKARLERIEKPHREIPGQEKSPVKPGDNISRDNLIRLLRGIDVEAGLKRFENRDKRFIDTLIVFANEYREVMKQIRSSLFSDTGEKFLLMVHKLKGASGIISAKGVHAAAAELHHAIEENRDKNDLERLAGKLAEELTPVLDSILAVKAEMGKMETSIPAGEIKDPDLEAVQPLVMKLAGLLEAGDSQAVQPAGELMTHLVHTHAAEDARALKEQVESTCFRDARETLDKIIHTSGIKI